MLTQEGCYAIYQEQHKDLLRRAEEQRRIQEALAGRQRQHQFYHRALARLGRRLAAREQVLKTRYAPVANNSGANHLG